MINYKRMIVRKTLIKLYMNIMKLAKKIRNAADT